MTMTAELPTVDVEVLQLLFGEDHQVESVDNSTSKVRFTVNNLSETSQPLDGDIIATGEARNARHGERRTHYLVRIAGQLASFRICSADPESGYQAFATGQIMDDTPENEAHVIRSIEALCDC